MNRLALRLGFAFLACSVANTIPCIEAAGQSTRPREAAQPDNKAFETALRTDLNAARIRLFNSTRPQENGPEILRIYDSAIAYCIPGNDRTLIRDACALRLTLEQLAAMKPEQTASFIRIANEHPELYRSVLLAIGPDDSAEGVWSVLATLLGQRPIVIAEKPNDKGVPAELIAAFCIVYDRAGKDDTRHILEVYDHFAANWARMPLAKEKIVPPPEVLALVVSPSPKVDADQLDWAYKNYHGNPAIGKLYSTIVYDTAHFKYNRPKKIDSAPGGYTLQNIKKVGGVCVEQAYFAANVAKAIGIPAVMVSAAGSDVGHAWVGYMKSVGNNKWAWDFDEGRYKEYQDLRGNVLDPQSGKSIPDGYIGLTAGLMSAGENREYAYVLVDAAKRLAEAEVGRVRFPPLPPAGSPESAVLARSLGFESQLQLIETGLRACPAARRGWESIAGLAATGKLSTEQLDIWAKRVMELAGDDYPDFAFNIMGQIIAGAAPAEEQDKLWEWMIGRFNQRKDLAAGAWLGRGDLWQKSRNPKRAYEAYHQVVERYPNQGTLIVDALERCQRVLPPDAPKDAAIDLYKDGWGRISKPKQMSNEFAAGSTYVTVGNRLANLLAGAGRAKEAETIRKAVAQVTGKEDK